MATSDAGTNAAMRMNAQAQGNAAILGRKGTKIRKGATGMAADVAMR
jgi:hypothetical protein